MPRPLYELLDEPTPTQGGLLGKPKEYHPVGALKHAATQALGGVGGLPSLIGAVVPGEDVFERVGKETKEYWSGVADRDPDVQEFTQALSEGREGFVTEAIGSMGPTVAALTMNVIPVVGPALATGYFFKLNRDEVYDLAKAKGADEKTAKRVALAGGAVNSVLDMVGIGRISKMFKPGRAFAQYLTGLAASTITEGGTEGFQEVISEVSSDWAARPKGETTEQFSERMVAKIPELTEKFKHAAAIGGFMGGVLGGAGVIAQPKQPAIGKLTDLLAGKEGRYSRSGARITGEEGAPQPRQPLQAFREVPAEQIPMVGPTPAEKAIKKRFGEPFKIVTDSEGRKRTFYSEKAYMEWEARQAKKEPAPEAKKIRTDVFFDQDFAERNVPKLEERIVTTHKALWDSESFGKSEFYDGSYPIPKQGGIIDARKTDRYKTDNTYKTKVDTAIKNITDSIVDANKKRMILIGKPDTGTFGVDYAVEKVKAGYTVNVVRAWNNEARQKYPHTSYLGDISVREVLQNSLDAVMESIEQGEIKKGEIRITPTDADGPYYHKGFEVIDNGIGMSDVDIATKFLALHSTGKAIEGRFGGFGIAKAVILGPSESANWTLETRDNYFTHDLAQNNKQVQTIKRRQGTKINVTSATNIITNRAKEYVETTEYPKNVTAYYDGVLIKGDVFKNKKSQDQHGTIEDHTKYTVRYFPKSAKNLDKKYIIRLVDKKTGAKLTQGISDIYNEGFSGTMVLDIETSATPGSSQYPLTDSRMELRWGGDAKKVLDKTVEKHSIDPLSAKRVGIEHIYYDLQNRAEWNNTIVKTQTDKGYQKLQSTINKIWVDTANFFGHNNPTPFTPLKELKVKIDVGFKGYKGGTMFHAKHLAAYEATSRLMAYSAGSNVTNFYGMLPKTVDGGTTGAEFGHGSMGLNFVNIDKTSLKNPVEYAMYLRDLVAHELTHWYQGKHDEEYSEAREQVARKTSHLFPYILDFAEATLEKKAVDIRKAPKPKTVIKEKIVEKTVEVDKIVKEYLEPKQLEFIFNEYEQEGLRNAEQDLYYPEPEGRARQFRLFRPRVDNRYPGQHSEAGDVGVRGRVKFPVTQEVVAARKRGVEPEGKPVEEITPPTPPSRATVGEVSEKQIKSTRKAARAVRRAFKAAGLPTDRITADLSPTIDLTGINIKKSVREHGQLKGKKGRYPVLGIVTVNKLRATVKFSLNHQNLERLDKTALHEGWHILKAWTDISESDRALLTEAYKNEEGEAAGFVEYMKGGHKIIRHLPVQIRRLFIRLKRAIQNFGKWLKDNNIRTAEDIFGDLAVGKFALTGEGEGVSRATFAGKEATTADKSKLTEAATLHEQGVDMEEIRKKTGWFLDYKDEKWRFEIDDSKVEWTGLALKTSKDWDAGASLKAGMYLEDAIKHEELFKAYPQLRRTAIRADKESGGDFHFEGDNPVISIQKNAKLQNQKQTLIHEIQHAVQEIEGFARGGSPESAWTAKHGIKAQKLGELPEVKTFLKRLSDAFYADKSGEELNKIEATAPSSVKAWRKELKLNRLATEDRIEYYRRLAGEIEANEAAARMKLTPEERKALQPYKDGIPKEEVIVRFGTGGAQAAVGEEKPLWEMTKKELETPYPYSDMKKLLSEYEQKYPKPWELHEGEKVIDRDDGVVTTLTKRDIEIIEDLKQTGGRSVTPEEEHRSNRLMASAGPAGEERYWFRFGGFPKGNKSYNAITGNYEEGVSAYPTATSSSLIGDSGTLYYFKGRQVGWGGDEEPVVIPVSGEAGNLRKYSYKSFIENVSPPPPISRAAVEGEGKIKIYHTSGEEIKGISARGGAFNQFDDVLFFSAGEAYEKTGSDTVYEYSMEVDPRKFIDIKRLFREHDPSVEKKLQDEIDHVKEALDVDQETAENLLDETTDTYDIDVPLGMEPGEAGWFIQKKQAEIAKALGYEGAIGTDEQGTVFMIPMLGKEKALKLEKVVDKWDKPISRAAVAEAVERDKHAIEKVTGYIPFLKMMSERLSHNVERSPDIRWWRRLYVLPYWLGKTRPMIKKMVDAEIARHEARSKDHHAFYDTDYLGTGNLFEHQTRISKDRKLQKEFKDLVLKWDGKRFPKDKVPDFIKVSDDIDVPISINENAYKKAQTFLEGQGVSTPVAEGFLALRRMYDAIWVDYDNSIRQDANFDEGTISDYRTWLGFQNNYFPHRRNGDSQITVTRKARGKNKAETVYREHFYKFTERLKGEKAHNRAKAWLEQAIESGEMTGKLEDYEIHGAKEVTQLPDEVFFQVPVQHMQQIAQEMAVLHEKKRHQIEVDRLVGRGMDEKEAIAKVTKLLTADMEKHISKAFADVFKVRGWARHGVRRKGIAGFDPGNIWDVTFDYVSGYTGYKSKFQAAKKHSAILFEIEAKKTPEEYKFGAKYMQDMLANQDRVDRIVDTVRAAFFVKYLGFVVKSGIVNMTQNVVVAAPILSIHTGGFIKAERILGRAMKDTRKALTNRDAWAGRYDKIKYNLTDNELDAVKRGHAEGASVDLFLREMKGQIPSSGYGKYIKKTVDASGVFMRMAEVFNRTSTLLAAYRIATSTGIKDIENEFQKFTKGKGDLKILSHEDAITFAKSVIYDAHFLYGQANYPELVRGGTAQKVMRSAYTFRAFTHNYLSWMAHALKNQDRAGRIAVAHSMRNILLMGGLTSIPFFKAFADMLKWVTDDDEDLIEKTRKLMPNDFMRDFATFGLPGATLGVDLTGSLSIEIPRNFKDIIGVPYAIGEDTVNMLKSMEAGLTGRALSETPFTPAFIKNPLKGIELYKTGQRTRSGRDINYPGQRGPRKITGAEAVGKGLGLQPISSTKAYMFHKSQSELQQMVKDRTYRWASRYVNAKRRGDGEEMKAIRLEVRQWNLEANKAGKRYLRVNLQKSIASRRKKPIQLVPKKMRREVKARAELYK